MMNTTTLNLNDVSLIMLKSQTGAFYVWIALGTVNLTAAIGIILTIATWKPLHTDTQFFIANLAVCDVGISLSTIGPAIYHLRNIYFDFPEVMLQSICFGKVVGQFMFMLLIPVFHAVLSFDRFTSAVFPYIYKKRSRYYSKIVACSVWIVSPCITASLHSSVSNTLMVVQCLGRYAVNSGTQYTYGEISISSLSLFIYVLLMTVLQIQIRKSRNGNGNVAEIGKQIRNKVTKSVALTGLLNFLSYTSSLCVTLAIIKYSSTPYIIGPYFNAFYIFGGIFSFLVYFCCQKEFQNGFYNMMKKIQIKCNTTTVNTITLTVFKQS